MADQIEAYVWECPRCFCGYDSSSELGYHLLFCRLSLRPNTKDIE